MRTRQRVTMLISALVLAFAGIAGTLVYVDRGSEDPGQLAQAQQPTEQRGINVDGQGEVSVEPDIARVVLGVQIDGQDLEALREEANSRMDEVIQALQEQGVAESDIQTVTYDISIREDDRMPEPRQSEPDSGSTSGAGSDSAESAARDADASEESMAIAEAEATPQTPESEDDGDSRITGYRITQLVEVTVRDINATGDIIDTGLNAGANHVGGVRFEVEDRAAVVEQARERAVEDARAKAEHLAELTGVSLGAPIYIDERSPSPPPYRAEEIAAEEGDGASIAAPIQPGESVITVNVNVVYSIE